MAYQAYIVVAEHPDDESTQRRVCINAPSQELALLLAQRYFDTDSSRQRGYEVRGIDWTGTEIERESAAKGAEQ